MNTRSARSSEVTMTELVLPVHTNSFGSIFGGVIMSWIDIAGAISAQRFCQKAVVTASVDDLHFIAPVFKGWVVNLKSHVTFTSRTSMEVEVDVVAENPKEGKTFQTVHAFLTFVALDDQGRPTPVPQLALETEDDRKKFNQAKIRREQRLDRKKQL